MNIRTIVISEVLIFAAFFTGCGGTTDDSVNSTNTNSSNTVVVKSNTSNPLAVSTPVPEQTTNNAPTLGPVVQTFYDALKKKDDALLKSVLSQDFIKSVEDDMTEDNRKGMAIYLAETDVIPDKPLEVRNEKIAGDKAVVEIKGGAYPNWTPFAMVKENGNWKFTGGTPDPQMFK